MASEPIGVLKKAVECWLLVWAGPGDWQSLVGDILTSLNTGSDDAHYILSQEVAGERWSLLLVHYVETERDFVVSQLHERWTYGFVNAVLDLEDV